LENVYTATGRRKNAIACVILKPGKGDRIINGKNVKAYIKSDTLIMEIEKPFDLLQTNTSFDAFVRVRGGGVAGQAGAIRLSISRALAQITEDNRKALRKNGLLTRDSRVVERKKYGLAGARRRYQFSKR
jgi:small subunit ribosomal protein S9